jgi:2-polyprenyl-6-methoxyphenol hydroxylase-like FAD-dependent oxidoreductase
MAKVIVLGGGVCGLASGLMLARDGHDVTVLERDGAPVPESLDHAWEAWDRRGVAQFRQAHYLQPRARAVLAHELPDVLDALAEAGAARLEWARMMPPSISDREPRPGDERLVTLTARRTTVELLFSRAAGAQDGLDVRRGVSATALEGIAGGGRLRVTGVRTDAGETLAAHLVVDAMGRRSRLPAMVRDAGGPDVEEQAEDAGFIYYTRFFRSGDGSTPQPRGPLNTALESFSVLTIPADVGTWSVTLYTSAGDQPLKRMRHEDAWTAVARACPAHAHWLEGEPLTGVMPMGGTVDRRRRLPADGSLTGLALLADAWACTNPSVGRGIALGLLHASRLRAVLAEHGGDADAFARAWDETTERELGPWYDSTVAGDRERAAALQAARTGGPYVIPADPASRLRAALPLAMGADGDLFRAAIEVIGCLTLPSEVFARPGIAERMTAAAAARAEVRMPGPNREELLEILSSAGAPAAAG